jgi:hypothetical protein
MMIVAKQRNWLSAGWSSRLACLPVRRLRRGLCRRPESPGKLRTASKSRPDHMLSVHPAGASRAWRDQRGFQVAWGVNFR